MKRKILYSAILLLLAVVFTCSYTFAADNNSMLENAANGVRNVVGGAENAIEDAARDVSNTSKNITSNVENAGNNVGNGVQNTARDIGNGVNNVGNGVSNITNDGYNATRIATNTDNAGFLGMNSTAWTWVIVAVAAVVIGVLIYSYVSRNNSAHYDDYDE